MVVESLNLEHYRNYQELSIDFTDGTNILYGDNAQGKTNILEALYVCSTTKSHRGSRDKDIIRFGEEEAHIKLLVRKKEVPYRVDMHLKKNKTKGIAINGLPIKRASELFGIVNVVFFSPEDLSIIKNGPSDRRKFIDIELCQLDKFYLHNIVNYNKIVNQRNKLLKDISNHFDRSLYDTLDVWDIQLADYGNKIIKRREEFIHQINEIIDGIHKNLSGGRESIELRYEPNTEAAEIYNGLIKNRDRDMKLKSTSVGPHRDDIGFYIKDIDIRKYGSQGQQRTAALSLKLSEIELVRKIIHDSPVLLLDDVMSELDSSRQNQLLNSLEGIQTIVTCTGLDEFVEHRISVNRIYRIINGTANLYHV
jgi:DNA replication and repair protein RecF